MENYSGVMKSHFIDKTSWRYVFYLLMLSVFPMAWLTIRAVPGLEQRYPASPWSIGFVVAATTVVVILTLYGVFRILTLSALVYRCRKSEGFNYSSLNNCDSFKDWRFYTWRHYIQQDKDTRLFQPHYGYRILGFEILLMGKGGWHKSNLKDVVFMKDVILT